MYNVLLSRDLFQTTRAYYNQVFPVSQNLLEDVSIPAATADYVLTLITRAEADWSGEKDTFRRCYRDKNALESVVLEAITRITAAAELLNRCNYVITYRSELGTRQQLKAARQPYVDATCRLMRLITSVIDALQVKELAKETTNAMPDLCLRGDAVELLFVRKLRMSYAEHLADLCYRIHEMYQSAIPTELQPIRLRARVYRNTAAVLIDLARAEEQFQADVIEAFAPAQKK